MFKNTLFLKVYLINFLSIICVTWVFAAPLQTPVPPDSMSVATSHHGTLNRYCVTCHNEKLKTAGLMLDEANIADVSQNPQLWEKVLLKLRARQMPPAGMPRPDEQTYDGMISYLLTELERTAQENFNPGHPQTVHRLNRTEYSNAIRDLLALEIDSTDMLPADEIGYGFDNIADVLTFSPFLMERYLNAAAQISRLAVGDINIPVTFKNYTISGSLVQSEWMGKDLPFGSRGGASVRHYFPVDGEYLIKVRLQTGKFDEVLGSDRDHQLDIRLDGQKLGRFTIEADKRGDVEVHSEETQVDDHLQVRVPIKSGLHTITATFNKDTIKQEGEPTLDTTISAGNSDPAFFEGVGSISIGGPYAVNGPGTSASREKIYTCFPSTLQNERDCAKQIISKLARRAYRRPITDEDLSVLLDIYNQGKNTGGFETGIRMALETVLVSPEFLFRMEFEPENVKPGEAYAISDLELASRLSFFLWSSIPDEELLTIAERGELKDPGVLEQQIRRMLADPHSESLVKNFIGQWLYLRNMERVLPDPVAFPDFDENLRQAMQKETELLFESMLSEDHSVVEILNSDYTFLNERLARHYGIEGIYGPEFRRVKITDDRRKGLLGQGSVLTVTSYPNRTAPTIRGKWILEQILGAHPPPPPPDVPSLKNDNKTEELTMRERMELHRANPACAVCHKVMDPIGFALENYDGLGRWRETSGAGNPIDASGVLPDGSKFNGPAGLRDVLLSKSDLFVETFTERLLTYALGRGIYFYDNPVIRKIRQEAADDNYSWSAIITGIVNSTPFQMRRAANRN